MEPEHDDHGRPDAQGGRAAADELGRTADDTARPPGESPREQPAKAVHVDPDEYVKTPEHPRKRRE